MLADGQIETGLVLEADERHDPVERRPRSRLVAGPEQGHDLDQQLGEAEPRHRPDGTAAQLFEQHDRPEPTEDAQVRPGRQEPADLRGARFVLELDDAARGRTFGDGREDLDRHVDPAARRVVLDHDGEIDGLGHGQVVRDDRRVVRLGQGRWRQHDRVRPGRRGLTGEGDRPVSAGMAHTDADGQPVRRAQDAGDDLASFIVPESARFAEDTEDRHAVDATARHEAGQAGQAGDVQRPVGGERRRDDRPNALQPVRSPGDHR